MLYNILYSIFLDKSQVIAIASKEGTNEYTKYYVVI